MNHKTLARIAIVMVLVFGTITLVYPLMFNSNSSSKEPIAPTTSAVPVSTSAH